MPLQARLIKMETENKDFKLYYSISEVAAMFQVRESTLRYWETEFPKLKPRKAGRGVRQYTREDIEIIKMVHHLVKEKGMTLSGARQTLKTNTSATLQKTSVIERLSKIREELLEMRDALVSFSYKQIDDLEENLKTDHE